MQRIILASASPRRHNLLRQIGLTHERMISGIDESVVEGLSAQETVMLLAEKKADHVFKNNPEAIVIAADTIVCVDDRVLEKPRNREEAVRMLTILSGRSHTVFTGLAVVRKGRGNRLLHCEATMVHFRDIEPWEIEWYTESGEYEDKAGAYAIQGKAAVFVSGIEGCYFNVVGLPLSALFRMLKEIGMGIENLKVSID